MGHYRAKGAIRGLAGPIPRTWCYAARTGEAGATGLEPATSGVTGRRSNQLSYAPLRDGKYANTGPRAAGLCAAP